MIFSFLTKNFKSHNLKRIFILSFLLLSFSCSEKNPNIVHVNEKPPVGIFQLKQTKIDIPTVDFEHAIFYDEFGYPHVNFQKFDRLNPKQMNKSFDAIILENKYIKLTLLPGKGKPYSFIYKVTGHEEFFNSSVAQVLGSPNKLGWWYALGGVEYTMPDEEHGDTWAAKWNWQILRDTDDKKTVRMTVNEKRSGLRETIDISIVPDKSYYESTITITNPTIKSIEFQHWINPMWAPGGKGEITPNTEFIIPTKSVYVTDRPFNDWMLVYHPQKNREQSYSDNPMRFLSGWKNIGDLLTRQLEYGFYSAFSHDQNEGIVRVFPKDKNPGCNVWAWGVNPPIETRRQFSGNDTCLGYVEMWGGITSGFDEYFKLEPGDSISWTEWMYPYHQTSGLHWANKDFGLTFLKSQTNEYSIRLCPSGDLKDVQCLIISKDSDEILFKVYFDNFSPKSELLEFTQKIDDQNVELVVIQNEKELVRLQAEEQKLIFI